MNSVFLVYVRDGWSVSENNIHSLLEKVVL